MSQKNQLERVQSPPVCPACCPHHQLRNSMLFIHVRQSAQSAFSALIEKPNGLYRAGAINQETQTTAGAKPMPLRLEAERPE